MTSVPRLAPDEIVVLLMDKFRQIEIGGRINHKDLVALVPPEYAQWSVLHRLITIAKEKLLIDGILIVSYRTNYKRIEYVERWWGW